MIVCVASCELLGDKVSGDRLWQKYARNPSQGWDNRKTKKNAKKKFQVDNTNVLEWAKDSVEAGMPFKNAGVGTPENRERLPRRDHLSWNATILQHANSGQGRRALELYEQMLAAGHKPSTYTFVAVLKACSSLQDLQSAKRIHAEVIRSGFKLDLYVGSMLVDVYTKCGSLVDARHVFDNMRRRNVVSWTSMILGYAQMGKGDVALELYKKMQRSGLVPNERTFVAALKACSKMAALEEGIKAGRKLVKCHVLEKVRTIHSDVVKSGCESDVFVGTMLVDVYVKCGSLVEARGVFETIAHRNVVSWTAMILGYAQMDEGEIALELYTRMQTEGIAPNNRTIVGALKAYSSLAASEEVNGADGSLHRKHYLEQVREIHSHLVKIGSESDVFVGTMLVDVFAKCGSLVDARLVFEKMPHRDVVSWNAMILGYAQMGEGEEALQLYERMQEEDLVPNDRTFVGVLKACGSLIAFEEVDQMDGLLAEDHCLKQVQAIHSHIVQRGWASDLYVATMLVDAYVKCGNLVDAREVFESMPRRDVVSWTAMIFGYAQMDAADVALDLYAQMQQEGLLPNELTFVGVLKACGSVAGLEKGMEIHAKIQAQLPNGGLDVTDLVLPNALIDMYGKCGSMDDAREVFDGMVTKDVVTWNALIAGYARQGESERVFELFECMQCGGVPPNGVTFLSVLTACSHGGLVDKGQNYIEAMRRDYGIAPIIDHYTCVVDLLARAGQVDKAMAIVRGMPFQPDSVVWHTLLDACRKWHDVEHGRHAFECAVRLDKNDLTAYVLLSNIYAACNMWEDVKQIQAMRLESRAWQKPGQSWWTDVSGSVHAFVAGGREHSESQQIYAVLRYLFANMEGHVSHLNLTLDDILDDQNDLWYGHSDKLASAYCQL